jgi:sortase A
MRRFIDATGRVLVTVGVLILLFVAYQLWGTGVLQARSQDALASQFEASASSTTTTSTTTPVATSEPSPTIPSTTRTAPARSTPLPANGEAVAQLEIPRIGVSQYVVEGIDVEDLRKGPGHYPATPLPGQQGNFSVAGHRTTYGAPFGDLDQLAEGDEIVVTDLQLRRFTYRVSEAPFAVSPDDGDVLLASANPGIPGTDLATLTLTTCHPKYSAAERLIVKATLELPPGVTPAPATIREDAPVTIAGLNGETASRAPAILWGAIVLAVGLAWWLLFHRYPRWYVWLAGVVPFLAVLFVFYTYLERLLPSSY